MLRLNREIFRRDHERDHESNWSSPFLVAKCVRRAALSILAVGKVVERCVCSQLQKDGEDCQGEPKSAADKVVDDYRGTLGKAFNDEELINFVMRYVRDWVDGV